MNRLIFLFVTFISSFSFSQGYDFQQLCLDCAEQNGFYCGDNPANWTQYSPNGCVPNGEGDLFYLNDGWEDCADGSDEQDAEPTSPGECGPPPPPDCDTVYVEIPVIEYEYIYETDTIVETVIETVIETQYIYVTDTVYADVLDTMFIDVIEYVEIFVIDTIVETEFITEYIDCDSGLPCNSGIEEVLDKSKGSGLLYNLQGQVIRKPEDIYIENGKIKYFIK